MKFVQEVPGPSQDAFNALSDHIVMIRHNMAVARYAITGYETLGDYSLSVSGHYAFQASLGSASGNLIIDLQNSNGDSIWKQYIINADAYSEIMSPIMYLNAGTYKLRVVGNSRYIVNYS